MIETPKMIEILKMLWIISLVIETQVAAILNILRSVSLTISQFLEARPDMMLKDFNLSKRSSLNVTRKLTGRRWLPILK